MANLLDMVLNSKGSGALEQIAQTMGLDANQVAAVAGQVLPAMSQGMKRNVGQQGGMESLLGALSRGNHQRYVEQPNLMGQAQTVSEGNAILGHLFGSKDVSRQVASRASENTGVGSDMIKKMLPMLATVVMGSMSKQANQQGLSANNLSGSPAASMLTSLLDSDNDGSIADDLMGLAGKFFR